MNWEAIGAVGEILGAVAVVATLFYLAVQIRQSREALDVNTRTSKASLSYQAARNRAEQNVWLAENPEILELLDRTSGNEPAELSEDERFRLRIVNRFMMQGLDADFYLYQSGLLDEEYWTIRLGFAKRRLQVPYMAAWWKRERMSSNYSPAFLRELDGYLLPEDGDSNDA